MRLELQVLQEVSPKGIPHKCRHEWGLAAWARRLARYQILVQNKVLGLLLLKSKYV